MNVAKTSMRAFAAAITTVVLALCALAAAPAVAASSSFEAYASQETLVAASTSSTSVRYVAVFGADTWKSESGQYYSPSSDLTAIARIDTSSGVVSILSIPRDLRYDDIVKQFPNAVNHKANKVFYEGFLGKVKADYSNYGQAIKTGAKAACKMLTKLTGISITDYVVVDLYTIQDIVDKLKGLTVNIPVPIKNYRLYTNGQYYSVNDGWTGKANLNGWDVMIASRARMMYSRDPFTNALIAWMSPEDYVADGSMGNVPELLVQKVKKSGKVEEMYHFDQDSVRQFLCRRMLASLMYKGLSRSEGAAAFVWNELVKNDGNPLMWTNLKSADVKTIASGLAKAKKAGSLTVYGAMAVSPAKGTTYIINDIEQYLIPMDKQNKAQIKATVKQFKAGEPMTDGWGAETIIKTKVGLAKGATKAVKGITYKATGASTVAVLKVPNKKSVVIPATVKINKKTYKVTQTLASSMKGSKVRTVTLGKNVSKIASGSFKGSKATTIVLKTTLLKKASVKGSLKGSVVKKIKVSVAKSKKAKTVKAYKKCFTKANAKWTKKPVIS